MAHESADFYQRVKRDGRSDVDLAHMAKQFPVLQRAFTGVFTKDQVPALKPNECAIVNIQQARDARGRDLPGTHWIAAGKKGFQPWSIDSYGLPPPLEVLRALGAQEVVDNNKTIQAADSSHCGDFALCACLMMSTHPDASAQEVLKKFVAMFDQLDLTKNDRVVSQYLKSHARHVSHHGIPYEMYVAGNK